MFAINSIYPGIGLWRMQPRKVIILLISLMTIALGGCSPAVQAAKDDTITSTVSQIKAAPAVTEDGFQVGFTEDGYPYRGNPDAPVQLIEYSDYLCPFCDRYFLQSLPQINENYIKTGKVVHIFRDFPIPTLHPTAPKGHQAALCVAEQGAVKFWKMHDLLYQNQTQWNNLPDPTQYLATTVESVGADMQAYQDCIDSGRTMEQVNQSVTAAQNLGFNATPTFQFVRNSDKKTFTLIGAYPFDTFAQWFDALIAGNDPPQEGTGDTSQEKPELPYWANQGLAPDPKKPGFTLAGDPYRGNPDAKLVIVEFSDFQCDACIKHFQEVQPSVDAQLIQTGKIMWVFKNFTLKVHPQSLAAAAAAECAGDQGKFWEMHDLLYSKVNDWAVENPDPILVDLGQQLGLEMAEYESCLNSRTVMERILSDRYDAEGLLNTTPVFIAIYNGQGIVIRGTKPADEFITLLEQMLSKASGEG
jgi:protein-disulfide isomerase